MQIFHYNKATFPIRIADSHGNSRFRAGVLLTPDSVREEVPAQDSNLDFCPVRVLPVTPAGTIHFLSATSAIARAPAVGMNNLQPFWIVWFKANPVAIILC